jgi:hypothetical protein
VLDIKKMLLACFVSLIRDGDVILLMNIRKCMEQNKKSGTRMNEEFSMQKRIQ